MTKFVPLLTPNEPLLLTLFLNAVFIFFIQTSIQRSQNLIFVKENNNLLNYFKKKHSFLLIKSNGLIPLSQLLQKKSNKYS
ncbi:hypothetical protein pb186bvf_005224 [Paramecium bursaria]